MHHFKLCLLTQAPINDIDNYLRFLEQCIQGGVTAIQFRDKKSEKIKKYQVAKALKSFLKPLQIPLIINDDLDLALAVDAEGVHLGQSDLSPQLARERLGPDKIIGLTVETTAQLLAANALNCIQYIGLSAIFKSTSKTDCLTFWGLEGLKNASRLSKHPLIGIGGITLEKATDVIKHGASGIALISAIHQHSNPELISAQFIQAIQQGNRHV